MKMLSLFETQPEYELRPLRGRQVAVIPAIVEAIREGHTRIVVQAPTGFGKTILAAHLMDRSAKKGKRPIFVAPAIALVEQTLASFEEQGIRDIGIIQARHLRTDWKAQIQIASRDTLVRRELPEVDFVIIDEVHDQREALNAVLDKWKDKICIGLSATPWSKGLGLHWTKLIIAATVAELIEDGYPTGLCPFKLWGPDDSMEPSSTGIRIRGNGEFDETEAANAMNQPKLIGDAIESWLRRRQNGEHCGDRTFLYGVNRAHAKSLMEKFRAEGVSCGYIDGESPPEERRRTFARYRSREDKILCNVGVLITGVDEDVRCIIDCAMRASEINWVQAFGRGLRLAEGKDYLRHYDHGGNWHRLGLPTWIHHDTLDMRKLGTKGEDYQDEKPTPKPRKCKLCNFIIPPRTKACPACGNVYAPVNHVNHEDGELVEIGYGDLPSPKKKVPKPKKDEKQDFYSGLLMIAKQRGFKEGWVSHKYREKFGEWPVGLDRISKRPSKAVREFEYEQRKKYLQEKKASLNEH